MKRFICGLLSLLVLASCTPQQALEESPLKYSMMPPYLSVNDILPPWSKDSVVNAGLKDFVSIPLDSGRLITIFKDTLNIPKGILLSDKKAAQYVFYKSNYEQQQAKLKIYDTLNLTYYQKALQAEKVYQYQALQLQRAAQRTWLEKNMIYIGFGAGLLTAIMTEWAVLHVK
jgi:hypothetical protein